MTALQESQTTGGVGFRVKAMKNKQVAVMFIRPPREEAAASLVRSGPPNSSACSLRCSRFATVRRRHRTPTRPPLTATTGTGSTTAISGSKQILSFLMVMFSLTEGAPSQRDPVATIPAR
jgi:hypothetical protein